MTQKVFFKSGKFQLCGIIDLPQNLPGPGIILCHGYTNTKNDCPLFKELTQKLLANGFAVFKFDQFGSGESPGLFKEKLTSILAQNAKDALEFFSKDKRIKEIGMLGISTGGTLLTLMGNDPRIKSSVLISPSFNLVREFQSEKNKLKKGFAPLKEDPKTGKVATGETKGELLISKAFFDELPKLDEKAKTVLSEMKNVLIVFGSDDKLVNPICGREIFSLVKEPKKLFLLDNAGHNCVNKPNETINLSVSWFKKYL